MTTNKNTDDVLENIATSLNEIKNWMKIIGYPKAKGILEAVLDTDEKRMVYEFCDGARSSKEISQLSGVNIRYVSEWGQVWEAIGILEQSQVSTIKGRRQKVFDLSNFDMDVPNTPNQDDKDTANG